MPSTLATNSGFDADYSNPTSDSKWAGVPTAGSSDRLHSTNTANTSGDTVDVHYGAYVTNYLAEGTYTGEVVYSAVVTPNFQTTNMEVSPSKGIGGTSLTIISGPTNISTTHELATSEVEVYFRQGGVTKGACKVTKADPSAGYLETTCTVPGAVELGVGTYDVVVNVPRYGFTDVKSSAFEVVYMQDSRIASICTESTETTNVSDATTYQSIDRRNSEKYYIRKFTFNGTAYCMMVQNLYLVGGTQLTSTYSNVSSSYTLPSSTTSGYGVSSTSAKMNNGSRYAGSGNSDGSYYNWCAATAGTGGCYNTNQTAGTYDICPKYWRLPTNTEQGYINSRINSIGINTFFAGTDGSTHAPIYAGYYSNSSLNSAGSAVYWWSSTQNDPYRAYFLYAYSGSLSMSYDFKYFGYSVRCLVAAS